MRRRPCRQEERWRFFYLLYADSVFVSPYPVLWLQMWALVTGRMIRSPILNKKLQKLTLVIFRVKLNAIWWYWGDLWKWSEILWKSSTAKIMRAQSSSYSLNMICCVASRRVKAVTVMSWVRSNTVEYVFKIGEVLSSHNFRKKAPSCFQLI